MHPLVLVGLMLLTVPIVVAVDLYIRISQAKYERWRQAEFDRYEREVIEPWRRAQGIRS